MIPGESHYNNECNCKNCLQINRLTMTDNLKKDCPYRNPDCPQCHSTNKEKESWCCDGCISTKGIKKNISCDNLYCPCHKEENWEKEYNTRLHDESDGASRHCYNGCDQYIELRCKTLKSFIHSLLKSQRAELIEEIENYFKGLIVITDPQATKESLLTKLKNK